MKPNETTKVPYEVIDNTDILRPEDWDRVVCVFTTGAEWQFKKFKWQKPVELFAQVKGFYTKWTDEQPKETIKTWNVEILSVCDISYLSCAWNTSFVLDVPLIEGDSPCWLGNL